MFGIGASLTIEDFKKIFKSPKGIVIGLVLQMIALPSLAIIITTLTGLPPELKMGIFVVSICPGGSTSNFISYIAKTDIALSISLTTINSFITLITIPVLIGLGFDFFQLGNKGYELSLSNTTLQMFLIVILPVILGIIFNRNYPILSGKMRNPLKSINIILLGIVFGVKIFGAESSGGSGISNDIILTLLPACVILHVLSMIGSYSIATLSGLSNLQSTTIGIEVGLQNTTLAILITSVLLNNNEMSQPALVFAMFTFFTTLIFAIIITNKRKTERISNSR